MKSCIVYLRGDLKGDKLNSCRLLDVIVVMKNALPEPNHHQTEVFKDSGHPDEFHDRAFL